MANQNRFFSELRETQFYYLGWDKTFRILVLSHDRGLNIGGIEGVRGKYKISDM